MLDDIVVSDIMTRKVLTLREEDNLLYIQSGMEEFGMRHLPVVDGNRLVGLISHRDILRYTHSSLKNQSLDKALDSQKQEECFVASVMTKNVITTSSDTPITEAAKLLASNHFGCLPVVEEDDTLVGIITEHDFVKLIAKLDDG